MASFSRRALLAVTWVAALCGLLVLSVGFAGPSTQFLGIADDLEQTVRFSHSVVVERYGVVSGQAVTPATIVLTVRRPDLEAELKIIASQLQALRLDDKEERASMASEVVRRQAELQAELATINSRIETLTMRRQANSDFMAGLGARSSSSPDNALGLEIKSLINRRTALRRATNASVTDLQARLDTGMRPVDAQIEELEEKRQALMEQRDGLEVRAEFAGQVGSVMFAEGETVPPFQPILTLHSARPSFVKGYIHESVFNDVGLEQRVWIRPTTPRGERVYSGQVASLGSRIVEFPDRLKVNPTAQAWGREVVVQLQDEHGLLLGERVTVQTTSEIRIVDRLAALPSLLSGLLP